MRDSEQRLGFISTKLCVSPLRDEIKDLPYLTLKSTDVIVALRKVQEMLERVCFVDLKKAWNVKWNVILYDKVRSCKGECEGGAGHVLCKTAVPNVFVLWTDWPVLAVTADQIKLLDLFC